MPFRLSNYLVEFPKIDVIPGLEYSRPSWCHGGVGRTPPQALAMTGPETNYASFLPMALLSNLGLPETKHTGCIDNHILARTYTLRQKEVQTFLFRDLWNLPGGAASCVRDRRHGNE